MNAVSTATRVAKAIVKAPLRVSRKALRKMRDNPVTTGLVFLAADTTKIPIRSLHEAGIIKIGECVKNSSVCFNTAGDFDTSSATQLVFGLGAASLAYLFAKTNSQTVRLGIALILSCLTGNLGEELIFGDSVDFIKIGAWPTFNIADAAGTLGGLTLLYDCFSSGKTSQEKPGLWKRFKNALFSLETWKARGKTVASSLFTRNIWNTLHEFCFYAITSRLLFGDFFSWPILISLPLIRDIRHRDDRRIFQKAAHKNQIM